MGNPDHLTDARREHRLWRQAALIAGAYGTAAVDRFRQLADAAERRHREPVEVPVSTSAFDDLAQVAYAAYGTATDGKNYQGLPMPTWDDLGAPIQDAWRAAARGVVAALAELDAQERYHLFTANRPEPPQ